MSLSKEKKALQLKVAATWGNVPVQELVNLIAERKEQLGENARDAMIGTAITALKSIRALTRKANPNKKAKAEVQDTGMYGGYSKSWNRPVFRQGVSKYSPKVDPRTVGKKVYWRAPAHTPQARRHVYLVTPVTDGARVAPYYVVATCEAAAAQIEQDRHHRSVSKYEMLARNAISVAMRNLHAQGKLSLGGARRAKKLAASVVDVDVRGFPGGDYTLEVRDNLKYSVAAVKGGRAGVNLALAKAANKIAGRITRASRDNFFLKGYRIPFQEITGS